MYYIPHFLVSQLPLLLHAEQSFPPRPQFWSLFLAAAERCSTGQFLMTLLEASNPLSIPCPPLFPITHPRSLELKNVTFWQMFTVKALQTWSSRRRALLCGHLGQSFEASKDHTLLGSNPCWHERPCVFELSTEHHSGTWFIFFSSPK